jgi:hypothetical protein
LCRIEGLREYLSKSELFLYVGGVHISL